MVQSVSDPSEQTQVFFTHRTVYTVQVEGERERESCTVRLQYPSHFFSVSTGIISDSCEQAQVFFNTGHVVYMLYVIQVGRERGVGLLCK